MKDQPLTIDVPDGLVEEIARRAADLVLAELGDALGNGATSPYLTVPEAAEYARSSKQRIYDLLSSGRLTRVKDGARVLVARAELEAYLAGEATGRRVVHSLTTEAGGRTGGRVSQ